jgi:hypothetical protein
MSELVRLLEEKDVTDQIPDKLPVIRSRYQWTDFSQNINVNSAQSCPFVTAIELVK